MKLALEIALGVVIGGLALDGIHAILRYNEPVSVAAATPQPPPTARALVYSRVGPNPKPSRQP